MSERDGICSLGVRALLDVYRDAWLSPVEVVAALLERALDVGERLGAFTVVCEQRAAREAQESAERWRTGRARPLEGLPFAAKDLFDTAGVVTAYGSAHHEGHVPERDAAIVTALRAAGAILLGKTTTHEYAWGITTVGAPGGTARNPWDPERIAGGSSGGSAVAVAAGAVPLALGTDTGGSVRIPAAMCGVTGYKPTYGLLPAVGVFPLAASLDHVGLLARTPADVARVLRHLPLPLGANAPGDRIGVADPASPAVALALDALAGAQSIAVDAIAWPDGEEALEAFTTIQRAEALCTHHERGLFPSGADGYGAGMLARLKLAQHVEPVDVVAATQRREALRARCLQALAGVDVAVLDVVPCAPPRIAELDAQADEALRAAVLPHTVAQSLAGLPSCTVRVGAFAEGTPMAVQLVGRPMADRAVLQAAGGLQELCAARGD
jgi:aspartyl-tRNA(Asn)/glutamyl-tRNA(Gln) amidotransferase subunit A